MKTNPANAIKDIMWDFVKDGKQEANIPALKEYVYDLIQMTTQKTGGQEPYKKAHELSFDNLDMTLWSIVIEATCLVLSGELDKLEGKKGAKEVEFVSVSESNTSNNGG